LKLIVDTNIILSALIKGSKVRAIPMSPNHRFYIPEYALEEIEKHLCLVVEKTALSENEVKLALDILLTNMQVIHSEDIMTKLNEVEEIMGSHDMGDVPFLAAALSIDCDGIWSDDKDFNRLQPSDL